MATLAQIRERVSRKTKDRDNTALSAPEVDFEINRAVEFYSNQRFWFNEDLADITLTAGNQVIPSIPSDLSSELQVNAITLIDDQVKVNLIKLLPSEFVERDDDQTGRPYFYTYRDGQYLLLPTPNEAYPIKLRYLKTYADLVADGDTNDFTINAPQLIMLHAIKNIYAEDNEDSARGQYYQSLEDRELRMIKKRTDQRNSTGYLYNHSILETTYYI